MPPRQTLRCRAAMVVIAVLFLSMNTAGCNSPNPYTNSNGLSDDSPGDDQSWAFEDFDITLEEDSLIIEDPASVLALRISWSGNAEEGVQEITSLSGTTRRGTPFSATIEGDTVTDLVLGSTVAQVARTADGEFRLTILNAASQAKRRQAHHGSSLGEMIFPTLEEDQIWEDLAWRTARECIDQNVLCCCEVEEFSALKGLLRLVNAYTVYHGIAEACVDWEDPDAAFCQMAAEVTEGWAALMDATTLRYADYLPAEFVAHCFSCTETLCTRNTVQSDCGEGYACVKNTCVADEDGQNNVNGNGNPDDQNGEADNADANQSEQDSTEEPHIEIVGGPSTIDYETGTAHTYTVDIVGVDFSQVKVYWASECEAACTAYPGCVGGCDAYAGIVKSDTFAEDGFLATLRIYEPYEMLSTLPFVVTIRAILIDIGASNYGTMATAEMVVNIN